MSEEFKFTVPGSICVFTANPVSLRNTIDGKLYENWDVSWINESGVERRIVYDKDELIKLLCVWKAEYKSGWAGLFTKEKEEGKELEQEYTGGSSSYYKVFVKNPTTLPEPYEAECNDIIEALKMNFAEGNAFKAIWRKAKARLGVKKKGYDNGLYDSEKVAFFGERMIIEAKEGE